MAARKKKNKRSKRSSSIAPIESALGESMTIAWTVSVTTLLFCNLTNVVVHFYVSGNPEAKRMLLLQEILLAAGAIIGVLSLIMIPIVHRVRQVPPPRGLVVFGVCCAVAPILTLFLRSAS